MSMYINRCDKCGTAIDRGGREKLAMLRETGKGIFSTDGFSRYYCAGCAEEAKKAIRRWEMERK